MEAENPPTSIEQWYRRATALDRNWRESRKEEERIRGREEKKAPKLWQQSVLINRESKVQVWPRRQEMQQQRVTMGPALMEGVERTNVVVVRGQGTGIPQRRDPFAMEIDRGRNCFACGGFGHMAHHCKNRGRMMRRVDIGGRFEGNIEQIGHLKEVENLEASTKFL